MPKVPKVVIDACLKYIDYLKNDLSYIIDSKNIAIKIHHDVAVELNGRGQITTDMVIDFDDNYKKFYDEYISRKGEEIELLITQLKDFINRAEG